MGKVKSFPTPWLNTSKNKNGSTNRKGSDPNISKKTPAWTPPVKTTLPTDKEETPPHA